MSQPHAIELTEALVASLRKQSPRGAKCTFLNCEMHLTAGGVTVSGDLFSVTKPLFGKPDRVQRTLDLSQVRLLDELGPILMGRKGVDHVTLDLIITDDGFTRFISFEPLRRIGGDDDFFRSKHRAYQHLDPWLASID